MNRLVVVMIALTLALSAHRSAAADIFLLIPGVEGESTDSRHARWIDVLGLGEGVNFAAAGSTVGGPTGKATFSEVSIVKALDKASPLLLVGAASNQHYATATIELVSPATRLTYFKIQLTDVTITSARTNATAAAGESRPTEAIGLSFATILWTYTPFNAVGEAGSPISGGWDVAGNKKL